MLLQPIECAEHGYSLLMRGLAGQKLMADAHANCHTLIFIEIQAQRNFLPDDEDEEKFTSYQPMKFSSRVSAECAAAAHSDNMSYPAKSIQLNLFTLTQLTFAKIASLPQPSRAREAKPRPSTAAAATAAGTQPNEKVIRSDNCFFITPVPITPTTRGRDEVKSGETGEVGLWKGPIGSCCSKKPDKLTETISIRRDLLFLEQMFVSVSELRDLQGYYHTVSKNFKATGRMTRFDQLTCNSLDDPRMQTTHHAKTETISILSSKQALPLSPRFSFLDQSRPDPASPPPGIGFHSHRGGCTAVCRTPPRRPSHGGSRRGLGRQTGNTQFPQTGNPSSPGGIGPRLKVHPQSTPW